jgi:hypothetical protein
MQHYTMEDIIFITSNATHQNYCMQCAMIWEECTNVIQMHNKLQLIYDYSEYQHESIEIHKSINIHSICLSGTGQSSESLSPSEVFMRLTIWRATAPLFSIEVLLYSCYSPASLKAQFAHYWSDVKILESTSIPLLHCIAKFQKISSSNNYMWHSKPLLCS